MGFQSAFPTGGSVSVLKPGSCPPVGCAVWLASDSPLTGLAFISADIRRRLQGRLAGIQGRNEQSPGAADSKPNSIFGKRNHAETFKKESVCKKENKAESYKWKLEKSL